ncbi:hypothetical protein ACWOHD_004470 [Vibrio parahaemolyticus]
MCIRCGKKTARCGFVSMLVAMNMGIVKAGPGTSFAVINGIGLVTGPR